MDKRTALRIKNDLVDAGGDAVRRAFAGSPSPEQLYHFTDTHGLVEILRTKSLRASLATGLSDDSEVRYAIQLAKVELVEQPGAVPKKFLERVIHFLDPLSPLGSQTMNFETYVISFCSRIDRSVHWLHYGKQGAGCAVRFNVAELIQKPFELVAVAYDPEVQRRIISEIVGASWTAVVKNDLANPDEGLESILFDVGAHSAAAHIRMAAPGIKNPAFSNEEEWRLITYEWAGTEDGSEADGEDLLPGFRVVAGRIVPYLDLSFTNLPVAEVVLGASSPMRVDDAGLRILLKKTSPGRHVAISRSAVPVRP